MIRLSLLLLLTNLATTLAFTPITQPRWGMQSVSKTQLNEEKVDTNFDGVDIVNLLGLRKVEKLIRKSARRAEAAKKPAVGSSGAKPALKLIIAGAPASGKGTQCELIKKTYGVTHLSTGDMLRAAVAAGSDVGKAAKEYMDAGKLVPDEVIIGVVSDRLYFASILL